MSDPYAPPGADVAPAAAAAEDRPAEPRVPASGALAVLLSILAVGAGHVYVGRARRGLACLGAVSAAGILFGALAAPAFRAAGIVGFGLVFAVPLGLFFAAVIDAARSADARTKKVARWAVLASLLGFYAARQAMALAVRTLFLEAFLVPSGSMLPTIGVADHMFVDKMAPRVRAVKRGEVIVFPLPDHPADAWVKRVIGLPGDTVEVGPDGVTIDGWRVPRCPLGEWSYDAEERHHGQLSMEFLGDASYLVFDDADLPGAAHGRWSVAQGQVFTMGDNRANSYDSRTWLGGRGGGVPLIAIRGTALAVWMAMAHDGESLDWSRIGADLTGRHVAVPPGSPALASAIEECLRTRPSGTLGPSRGAP